MYVYGMYYSLCALFFIDLCITLMTVGGPEAQGEVDGVSNGDGGESTCMCDA